MSEGDWDAEVQWAGKMLFLGSDDRGHTLVYDSSEDGVGGDRPHAFPPHFPRCLLRDGWSRCSTRGNRSWAPQGPLERERPQSGYPRPYKAIEVKYILSGESLKKEDVDEAVEQSMLKFCSVAATLRPGVKITYSYELLPA